MRRILFAAALAAIVGSQAAKATTVYSVYTDDFEGHGGLDTVSLPTDDAGFDSPNQSQFLGMFANNDTVTLSLFGLVPGQTYSLAFDLFLGQSWDGNSTQYGPDRWSLTAGSTTLIDTTFIALVPDDGILNNFTQDYSDTNLIGPGSNPQYADADVKQTSGSYFDRYAIYYFGHGDGNPMLSFVPTSSSMDIVFAGHGLQDASDEFWAIDNVAVTTTYSDGSPSPVPLPAAAPAGLALLAGLGLRRRRA